MNCTQLLWLVGIASLLAGCFFTWLYFKSKIKSMIESLHSERATIKHLETEYSQLRTTSKAEILGLRDALSEEMSNENLDLELKRKYDLLKVDYDALKSKAYAEERSIEEVEKNIKTTKSKESVKEASVSHAIPQESSTAVNNLKGKLSECKKKNDKKRKELRELKSQISKLNKKLEAKVNSDGILEQVKITKSLRVDKLKDWLRKDNAYKIKKKVSTKKIKKK